MCVRGKKIEVSVCMYRLMLENDVNHLQRQTGNTSQQARCEACGFKWQVF